MKLKDKIIILGLLLFSIVSCQESFLEIDPLGSVSQSTLTNEEGVNKLLIGAYACMNNAAAKGGGAQSSDAYVFGCDENRIGTEDGVSSYDAFLWSPTGSGPYGGPSYEENKWIYQYSAIGRANDVLRILRDVEDSTPEKLLQIEAEAKFIRGVFYLRLAKYFKNVVWVDENIHYSLGNYFLRNDVDIIPKIEADFSFAANNLTETKNEVGRANKWAAKSFLVKTYMLQHKYLEAKELLDGIITNGQTSNGLKYALLKKYNDNFISSAKNGSEGVYVMQNSINDGQLIDARGNPTDKYGGTYGSPANPGGAGWMQPTLDLADAFQTDSETGLPLLDTYHESPISTDNGITSEASFTPYQGTLDPRIDWCIGRRGIPYRDWGLHPGSSWVRNQRNGGPYSAIKNTAEQARKNSDMGQFGATTNPYNIIRFADVLLWAAECEVMVGNLLKAEEYVNMIRKRAANPEGFVKKYMDSANPSAGFADEPAANYKIGLYDGHFEANGKDYALKAIFFERRLELAMEHHRFFDLVRYDGIEGVDFNIADKLNWFMQHEGKRILNPSNKYLEGKFTNNKNEILPIPQTQIDLSFKDEEQLLMQNPGY